MEVALGRLVKTRYGDYLGSISADAVSGGLRDLLARAGLDREGIAVVGLEYRSVREDDERAGTLTLYLFGTGRVPEGQTLAAYAVKRDGTLDVEVHNLELSPGEFIDLFKRTSVSLTRESLVGLRVQSDSANEPGGS